MLTPAQKDDARQYFVAKMAALYAPPYHIRSNAGAIEAALGEYVDALGVYGPVVLDDAWQRLRQSHDKQGWPVLAECLSACREAQKAKRKPSKMARVADTPAHEPKDDILTEGQLARLNLDIAECEALARRPEDGTQKLGPHYWNKLASIGRGILAKHNAAIGK